MSDRIIPSVDSGKRQLPPAFFNAIADFVSVFLLSLGLFTAFLSVTYWEIPGIACVWLVLLSLGLLFVLRLRWWVTPVLLGAGVLLAFLLYQMSGEKEQIMAWWTSWMDWAAHMAPFSEYFQETGGEALLHFLIAFGITAVLFLLVRRFFSFLVILALHIGVYFLLPQVQNTDLSGSLLLSIAGMIVLLPRLYSRYMRRRQSAAKDGGNKENPAIRRGRMQIIAIPLALVIIALSQLFIPGDTSVWKSRGLNLLADDVATLMGDPFAAAPGYKSNFNLNSFGYNQQSGRLGGPANLTDGVVLQVDAERAVLLRGTVYDQYTGDNWKVSRPDGDFRYHGIFMGQFRDTAFTGPPAYANRAEKELYDELTDPMHVSVKYQRHTLTTVFTAGIMEDYTIQDARLDEEVYFNLRGELYLHRKIPNQTELTLQGDIWRWWDAEFSDSFLLLENGALVLEDSQMESIAERYTSLPETLPQEVKELTAEITEAYETPYGKAHAIERWIAENCTYTLTPVVPPEDEDFVAHFLKTREGYCVYYATAMTVMARQAGIPARYVTGFGLESALDASGNVKESYAYNATGTTAHAWAELYFHGIGWVDFDPTRGSIGERPVWQETETEDEEPAATPVPTPVPTPTPLPDEVSGIESVETAEESPQGAILMGAIIAAVILLAFYAAYRILRGRKTRGYQLQRVKTIRKEPTEQFDYYFADVLKQLKLLQLDSYPGETLTVFSKRVDRRLAVEGCTFAELAQLQMRAQFRETPPSDGDVEKLGRYHEKLEELLTQRLGKLKYFFLRAIR